MGRFAVDLTVANNQDVQMAAGGALSPAKVRRAKVRGVVDSGAAYLVLPKSVADQLGLKRVGQIRVSYADRRQAKRPLVGQVWVELLGRNGTFRAIVEPGRDTASIGAIVLEDLDLLVDCQTQTLRPRDPHGYSAEIE
jgi:predicted aspartyl protease